MIGPPSLVQLFLLSNARCFDGPWDHSRPSVTNNYSREC